MYKCFKVTSVNESKNAVKARCKIRYQEKDFSSITAAPVGRDNQGLSLMSLSSHNAMAGQSTDLAQRKEVILDSTWVSIPRLGIRLENENLLTALRQFYNTKVQQRRRNFHQVMSQIEHKVNDILDYVESVNTDLRFRRMSPASYYEIKAYNEIDVFLILERLSPVDITVEELGDPQGYARIRIPTSCSMEFKKCFSSFLVHSTSGTQYLSSISIGGKFKGLVQWCFEDLPSSWRQTFPSCKLNSQAYQVGKNIMKRESSKRYETTQKKVSFGEISATVASRETFSTIINLIPVVECSSLWPLCSSWLKCTPPAWPDPTTMKSIVDKGVHLVAMPTDKGAQDVWDIRFLNARRVLIGGYDDNDMKRRCLQMVKVLCESEVGFASFFLPRHLEHVFLQQSQLQPRKEDWVEAKLTERFLELLVMLYDCLRTRNIPNFFVPEVNLFSEMSTVVSEQLSRKVLGIINDPIKYLVR
ncbi:protein mab-21-like 2 [Actinia tenebrosa]|uniref:Protein mab-21-like 2 n=1 Tax=Actinia tenebrosa TaxID=6105 RepID=A0A6P8HD51_ACTTE|nr:protein mab-21-like 2 [Actinia tenebrosa]